MGALSDTSNSDPATYNSILLEENKSEVEANIDSTWNSGLLEENKSEVEANIDLIRRDAGRSVIFRFSITPPYAGERLAQVLENTIKQENLSLHYYQGLHDIAGVVLYNMDYQVDATTRILKQISHSHLRDAMRENFANINWFLRVLFCGGGGVPFEADTGTETDSEINQSNGNTFLRLCRGNAATERCFAEILSRAMPNDHTNDAVDRILVFPGHEYTSELLSRQFESKMNESCQWKHFAPRDFFETA